MSLDQSQPDTIDLDEAHWPLAIADVAPRRFAIYGTRHRTGEMFIGYGLDHGAESGALFWDTFDRGTWETSSAKCMLAILTRSADARLVWIDEIGKPAVSGDI